MNTILADANFITLDTKRLKSDQTDMKSKIITLQANFRNDNLKKLDQLLRNLNSTDAKMKALDTKVKSNQKLIDDINKKLSKALLPNTACSSNPCQNGGTCLQLTSSGYYCLCPNNWEGRQCSIDVDECERFAKTDLGCQNDARCENILGGYKCHCTTGWFGVHCTVKTNQCQSGTDEEICGHGHCVTTADGFKCRCDEGWTSETNSSACTQDVNECEGKYHPCSVSPMVPCQNTLGSFRCGSCPAGYTGSGYYCTDINECETRNGGCSTSPHVDCINNAGSFKCGACLPGYTGDGMTCKVGDVCYNHADCNKHADCIAYPALGHDKFGCHCKAGFSGLGHGPIGCLPLNITSPGTSRSSEYVDSKSKSSESSESSWWRNL